MKLIVLPAVLLFYVSVSACDVRGVSTPSVPVQERPGQVGAQEGQCAASPWDRGGSASALG